MLLFANEDSAGQVGNPAPPPPPPPRATFRATFRATLRTVGLWGREECHLQKGNLQNGNNCLAMFGSSSSRLFLYFIPERAFMLRQSEAG